jgi:hypothetical protein
MIAGRILVFLDFLVCTLPPTMNVSELADYHNARSKPF